MKFPILLLISIVFLINNSNVLVYGQNYNRVCKDPNLSDEKMYEWKTAQLKCYAIQRENDVCGKEVDFTNDKVKDPANIHLLNNACDGKYKQCLSKYADETNDAEYQKNREEKHQKNMVSLNFL